MWLPPAPVLSARRVTVQGGPAQVFGTLRMMREQIDQSKVDPRIIQQATAIIFNQPEKFRWGECSAIFTYVRDYIRYVQDVNGVETLCDPAITLQRRLGDCDDQTMLLCALLESVGYPTRLVLAGYTPGGDFEHVYCQVWTTDPDTGMPVWANCDPTESIPFGSMPGDPVKLFIEPIAGFS